MATLKDGFSSVMSEFFVNQVATHLSEWLRNNKSVEVSVQDLCGAFGVACTPRPVMAGLPQSANMPTQMPNIPSYFQGTGASPAPGGKAKAGGGGGGRKKAPVDPNGPKCVYSFQRGGKKGEVCGEPVAGADTPGGDMYCKSCLKKKTVQNKVGGGGGGSTTVQPPIVPGGMVSVDDQEPAGGGGALDVIPIPDQPGMFKEINYGFILRQDQDNTVVAIGVEENGVQRHLTNDEKRTAQSLGLSVYDSPQQSVPMVPSVGVSSAASAVPTIPTIPSVGGSAIPAVPMVPQII